MRCNRVSRFLTKTIFGIDVHERYSLAPPDLAVIAKQALDPADIFLEDEPTVAEWFVGLIPSTQATTEYLKSILPSARWIVRYNVRWLLKDMMAGMTAGVVVVPQAMAIASLANVPPEYGLYPCIASGLIYWLFGTSKDVVINVTAVGALLVRQAFDQMVTKYPATYTPEHVFFALNAVLGALYIVLGLLRLGWLVEFIPFVPISAFITAAGITIIGTQIPIVLGLKGFKARDAPYLVYVNIFRQLPHVGIDATVGIPSIVLLFALREFCSAMGRRQPRRRRMWSRISSLRLTMVVGIFTIISYMTHRNHHPTETKFALLGHIDNGFSRLHRPSSDLELYIAVLPRVPALAIILAIGHIAIAKAMGRLHNYTINPSQELIALGFVNALGPIIGGLICTGSFGASVVLSESGVRSPFGAAFSSATIILALYGLTRVFYYIPKATMAGILIHMVSSLISPPKSLFWYWKLSPMELLIWVSCVCLALFYSLELSIYQGLLLSSAMLLIRLSRSRGRFLGLTWVERVVAENEEERFDPTTPTLSGRHLSSRVTFINLDRQDASNHGIVMEAPYPGVFIYRLSEGFNYANQANHAETLSTFILSNTRPAAGKHHEKRSDRLWNDGGSEAAERSSQVLPLLRAVVLDFAAVNNIDVTSIQSLVDLRSLFERYAAPDAVEWHFANVHNRWTRRALAIAGFGYPASSNPEALRHWKPIYNIGEKEPDVEGASSVDCGSRRRMASIAVVDRPFFHIDLHDAVDSAVRDAQAKDRS